MANTATDRSASILEFLALLPAGTVVAQLDDGSIAICRDVEEADRCFTELALRSDVACMPRR